MSAGDTLFEQEFYSGNTLTISEVKNESFESITKKLNRKNGDISFDNVNLAGLNYDIKPGEAIPFFTVFPAKNKVLGLKYRLEVIGLEASLSIDNS